MGFQDSWFLVKDNGIFGPVLLLALACAILYAFVFQWRAVSEGMRKSRTDKMVSPKIARILCIIVAVAFLAMSILMLLAPHPVT